MLALLRKVFGQQKGEPLSDGDKICRAMIDAALQIGAKTPREAAEISLGRPFTDDEWPTYRDAWEKNWAARLPLGM